MPSTWNRVQQDLVWGREALHPGWSKSHSILPPCCNHVSSQVPFQLPWQEQYLHFDVRGPSHSTRWLTLALGYPWEQLPLAWSFQLNSLHLIFLDNTLCSCFCLSTHRDRSELVSFLPGQSFDQLVRSFWAYWGPSWYHPSWGKGQTMQAWHGLLQGFHWTHQLLLLRFS